MIRSVVVEALVLAVLVVPAPARADDVEEARRRFSLGEEQYARGSYEEAYASYEAAYRAAPLPDFLFNMGQCQRKLGHAREALDLYRRFLDASPPEDRRVIVEGIVRDMSVTLPEETAQPANVDGAVGSTRPPPREARPDSPGFFARLRAPTWITAAGAVALAGAGGLFALRAANGQDDLDALDCERDIDACLDARDSAEPWFLAQNVTLAASGVALGVAIVLAIVDAGASPEEPAVSIAPLVGPRLAGLSAAGRF